MIINEAIDSSKIKRGSYVAYKWKQGGKFGPYIDWVHVEDVVKSPTGRLSNFTGWWNGENLKTDLWLTNVVYVGNSKDDVQRYVKNHTDPKGYYKE